MNEDYDDNCWIPLDFFMPIVGIYWLAQPFTNGGYSVCLVSIKDKIIRIVGHELPLKVCAGSYIWSDRVVVPNPPEGKYGKESHVYF